LAELIGPGDQRSVAADLIVLDGLRGGDDGCIAHGLVLDLGDLVGELDDSVDGRTLRLAGFLTSFSNTF
jgi:hypothetical protein